MKKEWKYENGHTKKSYDKKNEMPSREKWTLKPERVSLHANLVNRFQA